MEAMRTICIAHSKAWMLSEASFAPENPNTQKKVQPCKGEMQYILFFTADGQQLIHSTAGTGETSGASGQPTATEDRSQQQGRAASHSLAAKQRPPPSGGMALTHSLCQTEEFC